MAELKVNEMYLNMSIVDSRYLDMELVMKDYVNFKAQQNNVRNNEEFDKLEVKVVLLHYIIECYLSKMDKVDMYFDHKEQVNVLKDTIMSKDKEINRLKNKLNQQ